MGLVPSLYQSGETLRRGRITKRGNRQARWVLSIAANVILGPSVRRRSAIRQWGLRLVERLGRKKAVIAVARKLASVLWAMWRNRTAFEPRLAEAMPWLLLSFSAFDREALVRAARELNVQNRLGFLVALARAVAERSPEHAHRLPELRQLESELEPYRLAREDDLGQGLGSERLRQWVRRHRTDAATHWNLLTDFSVEHVPYVS